MKLSAILAANHEAAPHLWVAASWLDDSMILDLDRDDLRRVTGACSDNIRQADKDQIRAVADKFLAEFDLGEFELDRESANLYLESVYEASPAEGLTISVTLAVTDLDPDPDELNAWCAELIDNGDDLAADARAWLDGTAADGGPEVTRLVADWRANN